ncbi:MAG: hypothetical protein HYZ16_08725 [Bacteroidetes bacterium]|nr:hypothetical protein [Bacteroidota bacterium]
MNIPDFTFCVDYRAQDYKALVTLMLEKLVDLPVVATLGGKHMLYVKGVTDSEVSFTLPDQEHGDPMVIHRIHLYPVFKAFLGSESFGLKTHKDVFNSTINKKRPYILAFMYASGLIEPLGILEAEADVETEETDGQDELDATDDSIEELPV